MDAGERVCHDCFLSEFEKLLAEVDALLAESA